MEREPPSNPIGLNPSRKRSQPKPRGIPRDRSWAIAKHGTNVHRLLPLAVPHKIKYNQTISRASTCQIGIFNNRPLQYWNFLLKRSIRAFIYFHFFQGKRGFEKPVKGRTFPFKVNPLSIWIFFSLSLPPLVPRRFDAWLLCPNKHSSFPPIF